MSLPNFLLIGAMKAGTTTLYEDLRKIDGIYLPPEKEPDDLASADVETPPGLARYAAKFDAAGTARLRGDASTSYAKLPTYPGVAERARRVLGADVKILYLTRDPIRRIVSQYHHLHGLGLETRGLNAAVLEDDSYVAYSLYEAQLAPWRAAFGDANVMRVEFEAYIAEREAQLRAVCTFLGAQMPTHVAHTHRNASEGKHVVREGSGWARLAQSQFYLYRIKPLMPTGLRDRIKAVLLPKTRRLTETLTDGTRAELERRIAQTTLQG